MKSVKEYDDLIKEAEEKGDLEEVNRLKREKQRHIRLVIGLVGWS